MSHLASLWWSQNKANFITNPGGEQEPHFSSQSHIRTNMKDHEIGHKRIQTSLPILVVSKSLTSLLIHTLGQTSKVDLWKWEFWNSANFITNPSGAQEPHFSSQPGIRTNMILSLIVETFSFLFTLPTYKLTTEPQNYFWRSRWCEKTHIERYDVTVWELLLSSCGLTFPTLLCCPKNFY